MMQNLYISPYDNQFSLTFITPAENHLLTNEQLINLLYNDVNNLTSILSSSKGIKSISLRIVEKVQDNRLLHIFYIFT